MNFGDLVRRRHAGGRLVVQPRMGMSDPETMRAGLLATRKAEASTVGTITVDSYTRQDDLAAIAEALRDGKPLNGYPIASHPAQTTRALLDGLWDEQFPVQVRHGSARPQRIIRALTKAGLHATEGGPVSYCLPYGRTPLADSVRNWREACELLADADEERPHLESFGGCMLGQLCPPSLLVAISVLEAMFFQQNGIDDVSVSYAQQTDPGQDLEAVTALRRLCGELLSGTWHVVVYTYMGAFPRTEEGALSLLGASAELAVRGGAQRLIVKTVAEAVRIPTVAENVAALEHADTVARRAGAAEPPEHERDGGQVYREARVLVEAVLDQCADLGDALLRAFARGQLDVPFCLHPDNAGRTRGRIGPDSRLGWAATGAMPLKGLVNTSAGTALTASGFLASLSHVQHTHDTSALATGPRSIEANSGVRR
ncbi:methylaspartate mutase [Streptomyces geranii]|uniref:methylaspartate mutase n=1 Tax=Streptomyces geranii TaxID=2058923 RepID=UPI000D03C4B6|nr:methylaspartate mutase [Streptomyces geranii]